jgi:hypothetical protein
LKCRQKVLKCALEKQLQKPLDQKTIENTHKELQSKLQKYYIKNKSKIEKKLKTSRELKETSQIVGTFLKDIDPKLQKAFNIQLKKQLSELLTQLYDIQTKSFTAIWSLNEKTVQIHLSGWQNQNLNLPQQQDLEAMVDKIEILNFFATFLDPTLKRLKDLNEVLERLKLGLEGKHFKSSDKETQNKFEMFLRIMSAKLSALQNMDKTVLSIFKLFNAANDFFLNAIAIEPTNGLYEVINEITRKIDEGRGIVAEVQQKLEECLLDLKDYLDETRNKIITVNSKDEFKLALLNMTELSSDLFIEA